MRRRAVVGSLMAALLTACAATQPRAATTPTVVAVANEPTATAPRASASSSAAASTAATGTAPATDTPSTSATAPAAAGATTTLADENGPVTAAMAQVGIGGERYAALGDPNAPLTIVEYSDFG